MIYWLSLQWLCKFVLRCFGCVQLGLETAKVESPKTPGVTGKFGLGVQDEAGQTLTEFCQDNTTGHKHHPPTTQEKTLHMDITRWSTLKSDCSQRWRSSIQSAKTRPGADCGSDHEMPQTMVKLMAIMGPCWLETGTCQLPLQILNHGHYSCWPLTSPERSSE